MNHSPPAGGESDARRCGRRAGLPDGLRKYAGDPKIAKATEEIERLKAKRAVLPKRVPASDQRSLKKERKLIADSIKMTAYQIETELVRLVAGVYRRSDDEGRTLIQAAFQSRGNIQIADGEIRVTLAPQSSPHRSRAIAELCAELNALGARFPGTDLKLVLAAEATEPVKTA